MKKLLLLFAIIAFTLASTASNAKSPARFTAKTAVVQQIIPQTGTGSITGRIVSNGGSMVAVSVTLSGAQLQQPATTTTNSVGVFYFKNVPAGTYSLQYALQGFQAVVQNNVKVLTGQETNVLDIVLEPIVEQ